MYTEEFEKPRSMNVKLVSIIITSIILIISIVFTSLYFYNKHLEEIEKKTPYIKIPNAYLLEDKWSNKGLTVIIDEDKKLIKEYSFDGGKTWQKENKKEFNENQIVTVMVKDTKNLLSEKTDVEIKKIDKIPPVIKIPEQNSIYKNTIFSLRTGVTVSDKEAGIGKLYTTVPLAIDTKVPGTYNIIYTAEDIAGNITTITRIITVLELEEDK